MKYQLSYWEQESFLRDIDVAIIGSGIVGLSAAIYLKRKYPRRKIVIFERGTLPVGASTRNAGFACFGSLTELLDDIKIMGEDLVFSVVEKRWQGLQQLRANLGDLQIDYHEHGGYEMFTEADRQSFKECQAAIPYFNEIIGRITGRKNTYSLADGKLSKLGFKGVEHLILNAPEGQLHTGKMMRRLLEIAQSLGVEVYNGIEIVALEESGHRGVLLATQAGWNIYTQKVLVSVNAFAQKFYPEMDVFPARNQVLITKPIPDLKIEGCFHYDRGYFYFRNIDGRILLGGGRILDLEGEKTVSLGQTELIKSALVKLLQTVVLPSQNFEIDAWWSGILGLGAVKQPIVKKASENIAVAVRLSGMGVAIGTLIGQEGATLLE